ncbi:CAP domain-containing protein [Nocardia arthritidis]|nr:CAP domain-containing protein [Nocardia arthritidis]
MAAVLGVVIVVGSAVASPQAAAEPTPDGLDAAIEATLSDKIGADKKKTPIIDRMRRNGDWVFGSATIPGDEQNDPEPRLYVAELGDRSWKVALEGSPEFAGLIRQAPESFLSRGEKETFSGGAAGEPRSGSGGFSLPWKEGAAWRMVGGPHGNEGSSRPFNSIDFNGGDERVLAAAPGRVTYGCNGGLVQISHPNGYKTTYYHMTDLIRVPPGTEVAAGTYLGKTGTQLPCRGSAVGNHVHLAFWQGNKAVPVNGMTIGGWTFREGPGAYGGYAERNGKRVDRGGMLVNYGGGGNPGPEPKPGTPSPPASAEPNKPVGPGSGTVRRGVNLRTEPSLDSPKVGQLPDGERVTIVCTTRGGQVNGIWGPTTVWDKLDTGRWASDGFIHTGTNNPVAPECPGTGPAKPDPQPSPSTSAEPNKPAGPASGTVRRGVNLRTEPSLDSPKVGQLPDGERVTIVCTTRGGQVNGIWGPTTVWNKLDTGRWASDGFIHTGTNNPVAPECPAGDRGPTAPTTPVQPTPAPGPAPAPNPAPRPNPNPADGQTAWEQKVFEITNAERAKAGCKPLRIDERLTRAARLHNKDMRDRRFFSHNSPDGRGPGDRAKAQGYTGGVGENIAQGYRSPEDTMRGWMTSSGHRANILNCSYQTIGVGALDNGRSGQGPLWTQVFGMR